MSGNTHPTLRPCTKCGVRTRSLYQLCKPCAGRDIPAMEKRVWERLELSRVWLAKEIV